MRDQPDLQDKSVPVDEAPCDVGTTSATPEGAVARMPPAADGTGLVWIKRAAGVGGVALLALLGWFALDRDTARSTRVADIDSRSPTGATVPAPPVTEPSSPADVGATPTIPPTSPPQQQQPPVGASEPPTDAASSPTRTEETEPDKPPPIESYEASVRIEKGDTLEGLLRDMDFAPDDITNVMRVLKPMLKGARLPVGETIIMRVQTPTSADAKPTLQALTIRPEARREIAIERGAAGGYSAKERTFDVVLRLMRTSGVVKGSLRASADAAGIPTPVLAEMLRAFSWDVNFQYDVKGGDRFAVLIEQPYTTDGRIVGAGRVLWAQLTTAGGKTVLNVYRFKPEQGAEFFYYGNGQSVVKSFLRTPMDLSRVSSHYGMRNHPILGFTSLHAGVDFAAPYGTPILAAGAGTVAQAAPFGGYGNWVKIDHGGGVATGYGHMTRFAPGIRPGARVRQGQVIGFVGSTGISTGPHLHYELHQKGKPVNPLNTRATQRASLGGKDMERFKVVVARTDRARDSAETLVTRVSEVRGY